MSNADKIRNMSDEELSEYLYSVFIAGMYADKYKIDLSKETVLIDWLKYDDGN